MNPASVNWKDPEVVADVTRRWKDGQSAGEIALVYGCSRNAIIGKVHRLGLQRTPEALRQAYRFGNKPLRPKKKAPVVARIERRAADLQKAEPVATAPVFDLSLARPMTSRRLYECAAIVREDGIEPHVCCMPVVDGKSWCAGHYAKFTVSTKPLDKRLARVA
jgi:hypothetical protein